MEFTNSQLKKDILMYVAKEHNMSVMRFNKLPQSCRFGLIQEFADTKRIILVVTYHGDWYCKIVFSSNMSIETAISRPEAQFLALRKLNEIYK